MFIASAEVMLFWAMMWRSRRAVRRVLRRWRSMPFLVFGAGFGSLWATLIGVTFVNLGILARQRTLMMPFLVGILALAIALEARDRRSRSAERRRADVRRSVAQPVANGQRPPAPAADVIVGAG
jgi:predicted lipid-binding transport protein (Tim44 family)